MPDEQKTVKRGPAYEGYDAFNAGLRYEDCPYPYTAERGSDWSKWTSGWTVACRAKMTPEQKRRAQDATAEWLFGDSDA